MKCFKTELKNNNVPVARTDAAGQFVEVNSAYEALTGYTFAELKELTYRELTPDKWLVYENSKVIKEAFVSGEANYDKEYIHKSGEIIPIAAQIYVYEGDSKSNKGLWGIFKPRK